VLNTKPAPHWNAVGTGLLVLVMVLLQVASTQHTSRVTLVLPASCVLNTKPALHWNAVGAEPWMMFMVLVWLQDGFGGSLSNNACTGNSEHTH
jgi:hypothetical protein